MDTSPHLRTVRRGSRVLAPLCMLAALAGPALVIAMACFQPETRLLDDLDLSIPPGSAPTFAPWQRGALVALALPTVLTHAAAMLALADAFRALAAGDFFSDRSVRGMRRFSGWSGVSLVLGVALEPLVTRVMTAGFPAGERVLKLSFDTGDLRTLMIAGAVWVIAGALAEARRLADENAQFV